MKSKRLSNLDRTTMKTLSAALLIFGSGATTAHSGENSTHAALIASTVRTEEIATGKLLESIACQADSSQTYALYLPTGYTPARQWPILYAFDPAARGNIPVARFKEAAEKFGWIVAGSNNSRNGPFEPSRDAWMAMWSDTHKRFSIDRARVYATGFSGGARLAIFFAHQCRDCIAGVIACGAGFPRGLAPSADLHSVIFEVAGSDDFNFGELKSLDATLRTLDLPHTIQIFAGGHEWLPSETATEAVEWMEFQAMRAGKRERVDRLIDDFWNRTLDRAKESLESGKQIDAYQLFLRLSNTLKGLRDVSDVQEKAQSLAKSSEVKAALSAERNQIAKQRALTDELSSLVPLSDDTTSDSYRSWNGMIASLRRDAQQRTDTSERRVARRVLEGLFVRLFEHGVDLLQQNRAKDATNEFKLALDINPDRPYLLYYLACAYALDGQKKRALQSLQNAIQKGFGNAEAITGNKAFDSLRTEPQFLHLIQTLRGKP